MSAPGTIGADEAIKLARQAIASADRNLKSAAIFLATAEAQGKTQREMAEVGKSAAWVNGLLRWHRDGYPEDTPFGAQKPERDERHDERVRTSEACLGPKQKHRASAHSRISQSRSRKVVFFTEHERTTLVGVLGMLGSSSDNEALVAARKAEMICPRETLLGLTWDELIEAAERRRRELQSHAGASNLDRELGDYVIVHELLHCSVPNHGKLWKSRMLAHLGDHERLAERLQQHCGRPT